LEVDAARLRQQAKSAAEKAQLALADEATARAYLETKQEALERADTLDQRIISLRQDLRRIGTLGDELVNSRR
jgi:phage shock protein A